MSRTNTVGPAPVVSGTWARSVGFFTIAFVSAIVVTPFTRTLPAGSVRFARASACATSSGDSWYERSFAGSTYTSIVRILPPDGGGADTPGSVASIGRTL